MIPDRGVSWLDVLWCPLLTKYENQKQRKHRAKTEHDKLSLVLSKTSVHIICPKTELNWCTCIDPINELNEISCKTLYLCHYSSSNPCRIVHTTISSEQSKDNHTMKFTGDVHWNNTIQVHQFSSVLEHIICIEVFDNTSDCLLCSDKIWKAHFVAILWETVLALSQKLQSFIKGDITQTSLHEIGHQWRVIAYLG